MEMISKAIVDGVMQAKLEELQEPTEQHRKIARTLIAAGGYGPPANRAERRAAAAKERGARGRTAAERNRRSRGRVPA